SSAGAVSPGGCRRVECHVGYAWKLMAQASEAMTGKPLIEIELHQLGCELGQAVVPSLSPPIVDDNVLPLIVPSWRSPISSSASTWRLYSAYEDTPRKPIRGLAAFPRMR